MVVRELNNGRCYVSTQEDHAELAAQLAAHWGNERFSKLRPYESMIFATTFHDSGYREFEGNPPINAAKGRPYAHREEVPSFEAVELAAYARNVDWVRSHDPYAGLLVSMHRTGLWQNRYNVFTVPAMRSRERSAAVQAAKQNLESKQEQFKKELAVQNQGFTNELEYNYRALQIFDLLSLYFCCDGYAAEDEFKEYKIAPVRVSYDSDETVELRVLPNGANCVRFDPYPFDVSPLKLFARARIMTLEGGKSESAGLEAYQKAPRQLLTFEMSR
ncbi:MAG: DUF3891 family protein [Deltaproteobacteria bacterium]|nr:DUF3891 family protein [Deltaproteobacteria bacterium]